MQIHWESASSTDYNPATRPFVAQGAGGGWIQPPRIGGYVTGAMWDEGNMVSVCVLRFLLDIL